MKKPVLEAYTEIQKSLSPIFEAQNIIQKTLELFTIEAKHLNELFKSIKLTHIDFAAITSAWENLSKIQEPIFKNIYSAFDLLQRSFHDFPPLIQDAVLVFGTHGWYIDLEMPISDIWKLQESMSNNNLKVADDALMNYFENRLEKIENSIAENFHIVST
jgi:hypothetical protein